MKAEGFALLVLHSLWMKKYYSPWHIISVIVAFAPLDENPEWKPDPPPPPLLCHHRSISPINQTLLSRHRCIHHSLLSCHHCNHCGKYWLLFPMYWNTFAEYYCSSRHCGHVQCSNISYSLYSRNTGESSHEALSLYTSSVDVAYSFSKQKVKLKFEFYMKKATMDVLTLLFLQHQCLLTLPCSLAVHWDLLSYL